MNEIKIAFPDLKIPSEELLEFLSSKIKQSIRETIGALNRIISFTKIYNKSPTIAESKVILRDLLNFSENIVTIENIQKVVSQFYKISLSEMLSKRRSRYLVRPRQISMYLSKNLTTKSLPDIGREFRGRDHTTVIHSVKIVEKLINNNQEISEEIQKIKNKILYKEKNEI